MGVDEAVIVISLVLAVINFLYFTFIKNLFEETLHKIIVICLIIFDTLGILAIKPLLK